MDVRARIERPASVTGKHGGAGAEETLEVDICYSCFVDHDRCHLQDTAPCGRCGAPLCAGHLVLGACRYCEDMTDEDVRRKPYTEVE